MHSTPSPPLETKSEPEHEDLADNYSIGKWFSWVKTGKAVMTKKDFSKHKQQLIEERRKLEKELTVKELMVNLLIVLAIFTAVLLATIYRQHVILAVLITFVISLIAVIRIVKILYKMKIKKEQLIRADYYNLDEKWVILVKVLMLFSVLLIWDNFRGVDHINQWRIVTLDDITSITPMFLIYSVLAGINLFQIQERQAARLALEAEQTAEKEA